MNRIHPTSLIKEGAKIGNNVSIGPYTVIGEKVTIEDDVVIASHVVIEGNTHIRRGVKIYQYASIGADPQDLKYKGEDTLVEIDENTVLREFVTVHKGTATGRGKTYIGKNCLIMAYCHIAHDCVIGNNTIMANGVTMGGHVEIGNFVVIGGLTAIHQFCKIGDYAFIGGMSGINKDIPPFVRYFGIRGKLYGLNVVGLRRNGFSREKIEEIRDIYRRLHQSTQPVTTISKEILESEEISDEVRAFLSFIINSTRGIPSFRDEAEANGLA